MSRHANTPGGVLMRWLYGIATGLAIFTGMAQLPIMKRYYVADIPGMAWAADFYITSELHYIAAALLLLVLAWRLALDARQGGIRWTWGPRGGLGWALLLILVVTGAAKAARNYGIFLSPSTMMWLDFIHLGSAMAFMITGLVSLIKGRKPAPALD